MRRGSRVVRSIETTAELRKALKEIRTLLAEFGCLIFRPNVHYRNNEFTFVAVPKKRPTALMLIQPTRRGTILIRRYLTSSFYKDVQKKLSARTKKEILLGWAPLSVSNNRPDWKWYVYWKDKK